MPLRRLLNVFYSYLVPSGSTEEDREKLDRVLAAPLDDGGRRQRAIENRASAKKLTALLGVVGSRKG